MSDEQVDKADILLIHAMPGAIKELRRLTRFGHPHAKKKEPEPLPSTPAQAIAYAKVRLEALKLLVGIRWGTKARGPTELSPEQMAEMELLRLRNTPKPYRESIIQGRVDKGEITEEDADLLRRLCGDDGQPTGDPPSQASQESV